MRNRLPLVVLSICLYVFVTPGFSQEKGKPKTKSSPEPASFTADWRDTELKDFLMGMSAIIKRNILIDDAVKGKKVTIISQKRVKIEDAYGFMKSVLETQGFGLIEENDLIKVVKIKDALAKSPIVRIGKDPVSESEVSLNKTITQIVPLEFSNAVELEPILKRVTSPDTDIIIPKNQNTLIFSGSTSDINKLLKLVDNLDIRVDGPGSISSAGDIHIYTLEYNEAEKLAAILVKLDMPDAPTAPAPSGQPGEPGPDGKPTPPPQPVAQQAKVPGKQDKIKAVAHKESNSLIVTATPQEWEEIKKIIKILDTPRKQVLLEVLIVELTSTDLNDFGIDWRYQELAYGQFNTGLAATGGVIDKNGRPTNVNTLSGFSLGFIRRGGQQIIGILNANSTNENFNVLSAPQILTLDNQEAEINVGQDVPVRTQNRNAGLGGDNAVTVANFEYRPTGIKLKFTPHINKNNRITLDLYQEIKNVAGISSEATGGNPTFNKRDIKTTIVVDNIQTIVIGGLLSNDKQKKVQKIPILGEIPLLGTLFRRTTNQNRKTNLMVFLTPHILDDRDKSDRMTIQKKNEQERMVDEREKKLR
ncbi:type II secretion system protein GspD [Leptospira bourretii]|uniref:Type II secretion system protein GspD n=2 Tax=Leptospira TaxID=171 RepID=A0A4R9IKN5_9LEPT|nr:MULTISPECIES: type II secretion system secretin GspD [Leptospira]TGK84687.1 type II secretion system protein GspD [Leptospira bourretii]TGK90455.1 type II secretion system protein GspD [Leptospira bourretii]TGL21662.1 type II secretion system protein GspD [Leptospira bourretii]TGL27079.1 type II secretion system protein GspD [Leptospira bourretii]TGM81939.1 type II secretion system protein GspD [Leptospira mtsangambouensis]